MSKHYTYTDAEVIEFAKVNSKEFFNRTQGHEKPKDNSIPATEDENFQIENAIVAALFAIRDGHDFQSAAKTAEYFIIRNFMKPDGTININVYDSVYLPISWFLYLHGDKPEPRK